MFLKFYNLKEHPFGATPNPRYLYPSVAHREVLASLHYGFESNLGFAVLVAEPGMGKTTLLFQLLNQLKNSTHAAFVFETQCDSQTLLRYLLAEWGSPVEELDAAKLHQKIKDLLLQEQRRRRRVLVIIDEAQNLDVKVLETIRLLSDFETPEAKLLHIVLAGQPQLAEKLALPELGQLLQRIPIMNYLRPLNVEEVKAYVEHRLTIAGYSGPSLFADSALECIATRSGGVPRNINRICFNVLSLGYALGARRIETPMIEEVVTDLDLTTLLKNMKQIPVEVKPARRQDVSSAAVALQDSHAETELMQNPKSAQADHLTSEAAEPDEDRESTSFDKQSPPFPEKIQAVASAPSWQNWTVLLARNTASFSGTLAGGIVLAVLLSLALTSLHFQSRPSSAEQRVEERTAPQNSVRPISASAPTQAAGNTKPRTATRALETVRHQPSSKVPARLHRHNLVTRDGLHISWVEDDDQTQQSRLPTAAETATGSHGSHQTTPQGPTDENLQDR